MLGEKGDDLLSHPVQGKGVAGIRENDEAVEFPHRGWGQADLFDLLRRGKGDAVFSFSAENADLKARLERLERMIKERPYLAAAAEPIR